MAVDNAQELIFSKSPRLGKLLTLPPTRLFLILSAFSILLFAPAALIHVASIPLANHHNVGIAGSPQWFLVYPLLLPLILSSFARQFRLICVRLKKILEHGVITKKNSVSADDYFSTFAAVFNKHARKIFWLSIAVSVSIVSLDTFHLFKAVKYLNQNVEYQKSHKKPFEILDWTFAYAISSPQADLKIAPSNPDGSVPIAAANWKKPARISNWVFDVLAWSFEGIYIFLGFFCVFIFGFYLKTFADLMIRPNAPYEFNPLIGFKDSNLGLKPIGIIYNIYLSAIVVFGLFAVILRVKYILINCSSFSSLGSYFSALWPLMQKPWERIADFPRLSAYECLNVATVLSIVSYAFMLYVIVYFPMIRLRTYIKAKVEAIKDEKDKEMTEARRQGDEKKQKAIKDEIEAYKEAQVWPNGDRAAFWFLCIIAVLFATAVSPAIPAVGGYLLLAGGLWKGTLESLSKSILKKAGDGD